MIYLFKKFFPYLKNYKLQVFLSLVGMGMISFGSTGTAYIFKPLLNNVLSTKVTPMMIYYVPAAIVVLYFIRGSGRVIQGYFNTFIGIDIVRKIRKEVLGKILLLDFKQLNEESTGAFMSKINNDVGMVQNVAANLIPTIIKESITALSLLGYAIYQSPYLTMISIVVLSFSFYPVTRIIKRIRRISKAYQKGMGLVYTVLSEIFYNIEVVKSKNAEKLEYDRYDKTTYELQKKMLKIVKYESMISPVNEIIGAIGLAAMIYFGSSMIQSGKYTVGSFFSTIIAIGMIYDPVRRILNKVGQAQTAAIAAKRIDEFLAKETYMHNGTLEFPNVVDSIELKNVTLKYHDSVALDNVSMKIKKGQFVGLVGPTGSGKTSLINLIVRFFDVDSGKLLINGINIKEYDLSSLRKSISLVTQKVYIFNDTVANNVAYSSDMNEEKVKLALKKANILDYVLSLPNGIHTMLDEFGTNLSGGERQRIAIARALYNQAKIIIFDEATSALDSKTEKSIQEEIESFKDMIVISIAHRITTVENSDIIYHFNFSKLVDFGTHEELLARSSEYRELTHASGFRQNVQAS